LLPCTGNEHDFDVPLVRDIGVLSDALPIDDLPLATLDNVERDVGNTNLESMLREILRKMELNERDKFIILGYFNVATGDRKGEAKKLPQLAAITGVTPERVRQIKERKLKEMKKLLNSDSLSDVLGTSN